MSRKLLLIAVGLTLAGLAAQAEPAMWVIRDADSTIYLIGTMHLLKHGTEDQIRILASLSDKEQIAFLVAVLDDLEKGLDLLDELAKAWIDGDTAKIERLAIDDMKQEAPGVYQKLIVQRNIAWSEKIAEMLRGSGVQQIAVGAAHLVGPDSVQAQLAKRGIKVERY